MKNVGFHALRIPGLKDLKPLLDHLSSLILGDDGCCHSANAKARFNHNKKAWKPILCGFVYGIHTCDSIAIFDEPFLLLRGL